MRDGCGSGLNETPPVIPGPFSRLGPGGRTRWMESTVEPETMMEESTDNVPDESIQPETR